MKIKAKRIFAASLVALLIMAAMTMFAFMHTTTAKADGVTTSTSDNGITMKINPTGAVMTPNGWLQVDFTFDGTPEALAAAKLTLDANKHDVRNIQVLSQNSATTAEGANYASHVLLSVEQNGVIQEEKPLTEFFGKGIDWSGIFWSGHFVFCLNGGNPLTTVRGITFKAGFQWFTAESDGNPPAVVYPVATLKEDVHLWTDGYGYNGNWDNAAQWQSRASSIALENAPATVGRGDRIDFSGMTVTATFDDGTTKTIPAGEYAVSDYDYATANVGDKHNVTISYQGRTAQIEVEVVASTRTLDSITFNKESISANRFESLDLTDLVATLHFTDSSTMDVDVTKEMCSNYDTWGAPKSALSTIASQQMAVTYTHADTTKTANITLNVSEPDTSKGLNVEYEYDSAKAVYNKDNGYLGVYVIASGVAVKTNSIGYLDKVANVHVTDYLEVTHGGVTKTAKEWIADGKFDSLVLWSNGRITLQADKDNAEKQTWLQNVEKVTFLAGYQWVQADAKNLGTGASEDKIKDYYTVENAVFKENVTVCLHEKTATKTGFKAVWIRFADSIAATYSGGELSLGEEIDLVNLKVTAYCNGKTWDVAQKYYTLDYNTETAGEKTVTVTYASGATTTFTVNVRNVTSELSSIEVTKAPAKTVYELGDYDYSWDGIEITAVYTVTDGDQVSTEKRVLTAEEFATVAFGNFNVFVEGKQNVEVTYNGQTTTFEAEVTYDGSYGMTLDWSLEAPFSAEKNSRNITVRVDLFGKNAEAIPAKACMIAGRDSVQALGSQHNYIKTIVQPDFADYIVINGVTATEWMNKGEIQWMGWFGRQLVITLNNDAKQLCYSDLDPNYDESNENAQIIGTVVFKAGLQYYSSTVDNWPAATKENASKIKREKFACLTRDVILYNNSDDNEWCRVLKQDESGNTLASSLTVKTAPAKTVYKLGETFDCTDMVLHAVYQDGFEEDIVVTNRMFYSDVEFDKAGKQTVTIYFSNGTLDYEVTVEGDGSGDDNKLDDDNQGGTEPSKKKVGCGGTMAADFALLGCALLAAFVGIAGLRLRGKNNK